MQTGTERCTGDLQRHGFFRNPTETTSTVRNPHARDVEEEPTKPSRLHARRPTTPNQTKRSTRNDDKELPTADQEPRHAGEVLRRARRAPARERGAPARKVFWHMGCFGTRERCSGTRDVLRHVREVLRHAREVLRHARCFGTGEMQGHAATTGSWEAMERPRLGSVTPG